MIIFLKRNVHNTPNVTRNKQKLHALSLFHSQCRVFVLLFSLFLISSCDSLQHNDINLSTMRIWLTRSRTACRQQQHTRTTNNNKENENKNKKSRGTKAWLVMFCNCLDSLLGGGDSSTSSNVCVLCSVYFNFGFITWHHLFFCSPFGSVQFVQCISYRLPRFLPPASHLVPFHYIFMARAYCTKQCCYRFSLCAVSFLYFSGI